MIYNNGLNLKAYSPLHLPPANSQGMRSVVQEMFVVGFLSGTIYGTTIFVTLRGRKHR